jgi:hypothetical protein
MTKLKKRIEIFLLNIVVFILDRDVQRSEFISRKDNNKLFEFKWLLKRIIKRIKNNYN